MRVIWIRGRGVRCRFGEARHYGWRWMLTCGPLTVCVGRCAAVTETPDAT